MDAAGARTIGQLARLVREAKHKSLPLVAELTGMGESDLERIDRGAHALNLAEVVALARALGISPSDLTRLPVPAPATYTSPANGWPWRPHLPTYCAESCS